MRTWSPHLRTGLRLLVIVVFLTPLALILAGSLRRVGTPPPEGLELVPGEPSLSSYPALYEILPITALARNSLLVVAVAVPLTVLVASLAAFALVRLPRRPRRIILGVTIATLLVPLPMLWVPRFLLYLRLGILDSLLPLMLPALAATTPFTVLIAYRAFSRIPPEILDAARLEGAGPWRIWWSVALPQTRATTAAVAAVAFVFHWGNYLDALIYVQSETSATLPLGIGVLATLDGADQSVLFAGATLLALPAILALLAVSRTLLGDPRPPRARLTPPQRTGSAP